MASSGEKHKTSNVIFKEFCIFNGEGLPFGASWCFIVQYILLTSQHASSVPGNHIGPHSSNPLKESFY